MLSVQLFCLPCLILPAILLALQFIYNRVPIIKSVVHWMFPGLAASEARAQQQQAEDNAAKQAAFWAENDKETKANAAVAEKIKEGVTQRKGVAAESTPAASAEADSSEGTKKAQ